MTSLVVHFCSAPLVCFVDALDTAARFRNHRIMDLYKDAETAMDSAAELLQQEAPGT